MNPDTLWQGFQNPARTYAPVPFWFLNDELTEDELARQLREFAEKGVGGVVLHPRKGLTVPYLGARYMQLMRFCCDTCRELGLSVILYDEAQYPSGSAHGEVVRSNPAFASRCLVMDAHTDDVPASDDILYACAARLDGDHAYDIAPVEAVNGVYPVPGDGRALLTFTICYSGGSIRGVHEGEDDGEPNAPASADLLNPDAVDAFIRITHEAYAAALGDHMGTTVIGFFTDEPDITGRNARKGCLAWTDGFLPEFGDACDLLALWLDVGENTDAIRLRYRRAVNARLNRTYYGRLAAWCDRHGVALTGHPAKSWDIGLMQHFAIPGQDVVWRHVAPGDGVTGPESVLGKCAADAARHAGRARNLNECFGCCGENNLQWSFTASDMKWYIDYLTVRGCNMLVPHAFFYSTRDGRGDERPPDAGPNNFWWDDYARFAQYMARLCWLMTGGVNQARVAVLCEGDELPWASVKPLYERQIEFNYLQRSLLDSCTRNSEALCIASQRYTHVVDGDFDTDALPRDAVIQPCAPGLRASHVVKSGVHFYLFTNEGNTPISGKLTVNAQGGGQWWNAWTGERTPAGIADGAYTLHLEPRESVILCVDPAIPVTHETTPAPVHIAKTPLANHAFALTRDDGETAVLTTDESGALPGWQTIPGWEHYSGWVTYDTELDTAAALDLGRVEAMAEIPGQPRRYWGPFTTGEQTRVTVRVCNTLANRLDGAPIASGILGPVCIVTEG